MQEIKLYDEMKQLWRIGTLECLFVKCNDKYCLEKSYQRFNFLVSTDYHYHRHVYGNYTLLNGDEDSEYLGWSLTHCDVTIPFKKRCIANKAYVW